MLVLALDPALLPEALLLKDGAVAARRRVSEVRQAAAELAPLVEAMLAEAGVTAAAIDRFAVTAGPGSFTGLRVGLALMQAMAYAVGKPLFSTDLFTLTQPEEGRALVVLESLRDELFVAEVSPQEVGTPRWATAQAIAGMLDADPALRLAGNAAGAVLAVRGDLAARHLEPRDILLALAQWAASAPEMSATPWPQAFYVRPPDISKPKAS